jgi:ABC-2 type transport system ATP-binding protein
MDEAERCVRVGLLYGGRLIANDTPANIKKTVAGELLELAPSDFIAARAVVGSLEGVREIQTYGDKLHIFVDHSVRRKPEIAAALADRGIGHDEIRLIEVRMEEAFISLIGRQTRVPSG